MSQSPQQCVILLTPDETISSPEQLEYSDQISAHRTKYAIFDLEPFIVHPAWIAPSATVAGEVIIDKYTSVWYNAVIWGDLNRVRISRYVSVGEGTVIQTVSALPTGLVAEVDIDQHTTIHPHCTLTSCIIDESCVIGARSVIMEGARMEKGSMLAPGTVVPPGRLIPANTLWAGNPCQFVKEFNTAE